VRSYWIFRIASLLLYMTYTIFGANVQAKRLFLEIHQLIIPAPVRAYAHFIEHLGHEEGPIFCQEAVRRWVQRSTLAIPAQPDLFQK